jgi:hypothetical protein
MSVHIGSHKLQLYSQLMDVVGLRGDETYHTTTS